MTTPPQDGQFNWGDPLNAYIEATQLTASTASTQIGNHANNNPADPHGDRAYAQGLVAPITNNVNLPSGYVVLNSAGKIPPNLVAGTGGSGGSFTDVYDVVAGFGATGNGSTDDSGAINNALTACAAGGGGEVWIPSGVYACASTLIIGSNTFLNLAPGATIKRISGSSTPTIMLSNVSFSGSNTPTGHNIKIEGGTWDASGGGALGLPCTPIFLMQVLFASVSETQFVGIPGSPAIEFNGCSDVAVYSSLMNGQPTSSVSSQPAIRLNTSNTSTTPAGLAAGAYNNSNCSNVTVRDTGVVVTTSTGKTQPTYGALIGTDLTVPSQVHTNIAVNNCFAPTLNVGPVIAQNWQGYNGSSNQFGTANDVFYTDNTGFAYIGVNSSTGLTQQTQLKVAGPIYFASTGGGSLKNEPNPETWIQVPNSAFGSGWANAGTDGGSSAAPLSYRRLASPANCVQVMGILAFSTNTNTIFTFPQGYRPGHAVRIPHDCIGYFYIDPTGAMSSTQRITQLGFGPSNIGVNGMFALDI